MPGSASNSAIVAVLILTRRAVRGRRSRSAVLPQQPGYLALRALAPAGRPSVLGRVEIWTCISSCKRTGEVDPQRIGLRVQAARPRNHVYYPIARRNRVNPRLCDLAGDVDLGVLSRRRRRQHLKSRLLATLAAQRYQQDGKHHRKRNSGSHAPARCRRRSFRGRRNRCSLLIVIHISLHHTIPYMECAI